MPADPSPSPSSSTSTVLGLTGGYNGHSLALRVVISVFTSLSIYNSLELTILVLFTFKKYTGLYFWSLLVSTWGIVFYSLGFLCKFFQLIGNDFVSVTMITVGWWGMVTGQSLVLYSRLHLIVREGKTLRRVLAMIVINVFLLHIPTTILTFGSNALGNKDITTFVRGYNIMEKVQLTGFCIQETIISGLYLYETARFLRARRILEGRNGSASEGSRRGSEGRHKANEERQRARKTMRGLFAINVLIILMDIGLLALECKDEYILQIVIKGLVYGIKLKLEFAILGRLVGLATEKSRTGGVINLAKMVGGDEAYALRDEVRTPSDNSKSWPGVRVEILANGQQNDSYTRSVDGKHLTHPGKDTDDLEQMMIKYSVRQQPARTNW
jgi:hypothetical protein